MGRRRPGVATRARQAGVGRATRREDHDGRSIHDGTERRVGVKVNELVAEQQPAERAVVAHDGEAGMGRRGEHALGVGALLEAHRREGTPSRPPPVARPPAQPCNRAIARMGSSTPSPPAAAVALPPTSELVRRPVVSCGGGEGRHHASVSCHGRRVDEARRGRRPSSPHLLALQGDRTEGAADGRHGLRRGTAREARRQPPTATPTTAAAATAGESELPGDLEHHHSEEEPDAPAPAISAVAPTSAYNPGSVARVSPSRHDPSIMVARGRGPRWRRQSQSWAA